MAGIEKSLAWLGMYQAHEHRAPFKRHEYVGQGIDLVEHVVDTVVNELDMSWRTNETVWLDNYTIGSPMGQDGEPVRHVISASVNARPAYSLPILVRWRRVYEADWNWEENYMYTLTVGVYGDVHSRHVFVPSRAWVALEKNLG